MQRLRAIWLFWRTFIIGDDWTMAVSVAWVLLIIFNLTRRGARETLYLLPFAVAIVVTLSVWRELARIHAKQGQSRQITPANRQLWYLWAPLALVALSRYNYGSDMLMVHVYIPLLINLCLMSLVVLALLVLYKHQPFARSAWAIIYVVISSLFQENIHQLSNKLLSVSSPASIELLIVVCGCIFTAGCVYTSQQLNSAD